MAKIDDLRRARLKYDYQVVMAMSRSSPLIRVQAFENPHDLEKRRRSIADAERAPFAEYYLVHYAVRSLVGRGKYHGQRTDVPSSPIEASQIPSVLQRPIRRLRPRGEGARVNRPAGAPEQGGGDCRQTRGTALPRRPRRLGCCNGRNRRSWCERAGRREDNDGRCGADISIA